MRQSERVRNTIVTDLFYASFLFMIREGQLRVDVASRWAEMRGSEMAALLRASTSAPTRQARNDEFG